MATLRETKGSISTEAPPALYGTGTEDFFNAGWFKKRGVFSLPTHGSPLHFSPVVEGAVLDETGAYRLHLTDPISFRSGIRYGIEHGSPAGLESFQWNGDYRSLVFWYGLEESGSSLSDTLDIGDDESELEHGYTAKGESELLFGDYFYEGDDDDTVVFDGGRTAAGIVRFTVAVDPANDGVVLRRRADQAVRNQRASVNVDGVAVGIWFDAGRNTSKRWLDSEFALPPGLTSGKSSLEIMLTPEGVAPWSAYTYWAYSILPVADPDVDGDGCLDAAEQQIAPGSETSGGLRDPFNFWDFYDVYTGNPLARDRAITASDIAALVLRFGTNGNPNGNPLVPPPDRYGYHTAFDRGGTTSGQNLWNLLPPDGAIIAGDIAALVVQFGHVCA